MRTDGKYKDQGVKTSYFVCFWRLQSVLQIPVSEFVHFQVFPPALAYREEEWPVRILVPVQRLDLLVDVVPGLTPLLAPRTAQAPWRDGGEGAGTWTNVRHLNSELLKPKHQSNQ